MQVYANGLESQGREFWAKMTKFKNGAFELSVIRPQVVPEPEVIVHIGKDCKTTFSGAPAPSASLPQARVIPSRVRLSLSDEERASRDADNLARAVRRARQKVRHLVKSLEGDHMLTFSYRENMTDIERLKADWKRFLRLMRGRYPEFQFVCVREKQERGAYHLHVAVHGKQDIRWILRCWLLAIGQEWEEVQQWFIYGSALGEKSLGAVNVRAPQKKWGAKVRAWKPERLAGYMTKYLGKEFAEAEHHSLRYWHSKGIEKPVVIKWWLGASHFSDAIRETHDFAFYKGATNMSLWQPDNWENLYLCGDGLELDLESLLVDLD